MEIDEITKINTVYNTYNKFYDMNDNILYNFKKCNKIHKIQFQSTYLFHKARIINCYKAIKLHFALLVNLSRNINTIFGNLTNDGDQCLLVIARGILLKIKGVSKLKI